MKKIIISWEIWQRLVPGRLKELKDGGPHHIYTEVWLLQRLCRSWWLTVNCDKFNQVLAPVAVVLPDVVSGAD